MTAKELEQAKRNAMMARARLDSSVGALQLRLRPGNLATEAWDGVKDKSESLAEGALDAVRKRPAAVSLAIGAFALFRRTTRLAALKAAPTIAASVTEVVS